VSIRKKKKRWRQSLKGDDGVVLEVVTKEIIVVVTIIK